MAQRRAFDFDRLDNIVHLVQQLALQLLHSDALLLVVFGALMLEQRLVFGALTLDERFVFGALTRDDGVVFFGECRALMLDGGLQRADQCLWTLARREPQSATPICIAMLVQSFLGRLPWRAE